MLFILLALPFFVVNVVSGPPRYEQCFGSIEGETKDRFTRFWEDLGSNLSRIYFDFIIYSLQKMFVHGQFPEPYDEEHVAKKVEETISLLSEHADKVKELPPNAKYGCFCGYSKTEKIMKIVCIWK
ncbi:hypothetical protein OSTOST_11429 [Ostertagia ostertagi]